MARLFARIFENTNYGGQNRWLQADVANFPSELGFNDKVSSIIVYKGKNYQPGDTIRFYQDVGFTGGFLDLGPGYYANIHIQPYTFGDIISSAHFLPQAGPTSELTVRLTIRLYEHASYQGQYRDVLATETNLNNLGFNDTVSSIRVFAGEDYEAGWVCDFFEHADFGGGKLQPGQFGPGTNLPNIGAAPYLFNDKISSVRISRMP